MPEQNYFAVPANYNTDFFPSVLAAAAGLSQPFLVQQGQLTLPGATVCGTQVSWNGNTFSIVDQYDNPEPQYYTNTPAPFQQVWPREDRFPNATYISATNTFNGTIDCVGFAARVLAATGGNTPADNAYCSLHEALRSLPGTSFPPVLGVVPEAYQFAVSLAAMSTPMNGWTYTTGLLAPDKITIPGYSGSNSPGFSQSQAGDIVCLGFVGPGSNGHFMVLTAPPQPLDLDELRAKGVNLPGFVTGAFNISVYDSTNTGTSLHIVDSRRAVNTSGIGYGELYMFTNAADQPAGYIFGLQDGNLQTAYFVSGAGEGYESDIVAITLGRYQ